MDVIMGAYELHVSDLSVACLTAGFVLLVGFLASPGFPRVWTPKD